ncbi:MAG: cysteine dioxygenase [Streptosporangiaceae bacterium]|jgi:quercetin dioxygenase-like cupin family protein
MMMADPLPRTAPLPPARLGELAVSTAAAPGRWDHLVRYDAAHRWYQRLELTADYEIWLLSWLPGQETGFHDHGEANGAFLVAEGRLREQTTAVGRRKVASRTLQAGSYRSFGRQHLHSVSNESADAALSVHVYSPPLTAMRRYEMTGSGLVLRTTDRAGQSW